MIKQLELLSEVADDIDAGKIRTTADHVLSPISVENIQRAHAWVETGNTKGKVVLADWPD